MKSFNRKTLILTIAIGGVSALLSLGLLTALISSSAAQTIAPAATQPNLPRLLALEPTSVHQKPIQPSRLPVIKLVPSSIPTIRVVSTPTSLLLLNEQQPTMIGYTVEGRPLEVYTFGTGEHERMIVAGIHGGDEWNTIALADQLIVYLNQNPQVIPEDVTLHILHNINPDGEARAHGKEGRLNHNRVDLNRNFPVNWQAEWNRDGCWNYLPTSSGTEPGSESETQALMAFLHNHHVQALVSYHSAALGIFPGGDPWDEKSFQFAQSIAEVSTYPFPPFDTGCIYTGTLPDYAVAQGITAVDIELTNHKDTDFEMNLNILDILLNWQS